MENQAKTAQFLSNRKNPVAAHRMDVMPPNWRELFACVYRTSRDGQRMCEDLAEHIYGISKEEWKQCRACESKEPHYQGECLVCGTPNKAVQ